MKRIKPVFLQKLSWGSLEKSTISSEDDRTAEVELVQKAKTDPTAFDLLYHRYVLRIYHYLRLRSPSDEDAADLTQHVFVLALDALPKYQERNLPFAAWLFRIARNAATDAYRRERKTIS